ncbi:MAG: hypothetical protein H0W78_12240 [Planctomycetes bacterium]|jgi:hypothetical protein|nr:hypothetical protein [Planctomycetota bacterium]
MNTAVQTFANHRRLPPLAFALAFVALTAEVIVRGIALAQAPSLASAWAVVIAASLLVIAYYARRNSQMVQDRLILLEMRRRLERLLPAERHGDIARLSRPQIIALRFASDAELPTLISDTLTQTLTATAIKQRITTWQADWHRV